MTTVFRRESFLRSLTVAGLFVGLPVVFSGASGCSVSLDIPGADDGGTSDNSDGGTKHGLDGGPSMVDGSPSKSDSSTNPSNPSNPFPADQGNQKQTWVEFQAEDPNVAKTTGQVLQPTRTKWDKSQIQAEAIGRSAVQLNKTGDYVEFTTTKDANSIVVRYSIPDSADGKGLNATLGLYIGGAGAQRKDMQLTSHYAWSYNGEAIPLDSGPSGKALAATLNDPSQPYPHTFFDEYNAGPGDYEGWTSVANGSASPAPLVPAGQKIPAGTVVRIQRDDKDTAQFYIIDLVDFEDVPPPLAAPPGFTDVTTISSIKPNDGVDHADDFESLLKSHQGQKLYFPPGNYIIRKYNQYSSNAALDNFGSEIAGAGMWYTRIRGQQAIFFCDVKAACSVHDLAIWGDSIARDEPISGVQKAIAGYQGVQTELYNLWIEHTVGGIWVGNDPDNQMNGPTDQLHIHDVRIRDTYADGINLDNGTSNSTVENVSLRNTGDDAVTVWAVDWPKCLKVHTCAITPGHDDELSAQGQGAGHGNHFKHISVQMPWRANCFAAYGGYDNTWEDSTCEDVLTYPGLFVDNEFGIYPYGSANNVSGPSSIVFNNISLVRAGGEMFYEGPQATSCGGISQCGAGTSNPPWDHGAIKLYMREGSISDVVISNINVVDPTYAGIELRGFNSDVGGRYNCSGPFTSDAANGKYTNVLLKDITVSGAGTDGILVMDLENGDHGSVSFENVSVSNSKGKALNLMNGASSSIIDKRSGNTGW